MTLSIFQKFALGIAGVTALSIGGFILVAPHAFYADYGIALDRDPSLLSELRAPGAGLATLGAIMLAGSARAACARVALVAVLTVYVAFPIGRLISLAIDGMPSASVIGALGIEIAIATLCLVAFRHGRGNTLARPRIAVPQNRYPT
ncbi:protein of unknown function [Roseovarius lutimaris]|uniref:DUF4345 domain-containing protein n=1 Tax=Roseovarius lutimaris TaxID=1005928 RepID=A0A1I4ZHT4_9RHOB|nr:DUF4345 domain-containing protein [Roseovarius lutimaris]SFN49460.1 protein of unknown function [Roseovarius lutimaris]